MTTQPAPPPRFTPAPAPIPRDPAAGDRQWPGQWPLRTQLELELAAYDTAPGCARAHVCAVLHEWHADADFTDMAALILSELLTNAVLSTQAHRYPAPVRMWMLGDGASVLILIWDATMPAPVRANATPGDEHGRGLTLVDALSVRWGFYHPAEHPGGKVTWALLKPDAPAPGQFTPLAHGRQQWACISTRRYPNAHPPHWPRTAPRTRTTALYAALLFETYAPSRGRVGGGSSLRFC